MNTVFESPGLVLIGVSWSWAVALKLVRYRKDDPDDIAAILSLGTQMRGCQWTVQLLEGWLLNLCSPMGYSYYPLHEIKKTRARMRDAIQRTSKLPWDDYVAMAPQPSKPAPTLVPYWAAQQQATARPAGQAQQPARPVTVHGGQFDHQRELKERERSQAVRSRRRSLSAIPTSAPAVPTAPVPPVPHLPMPMPAAATPLYPPNYASRPPRSHHPSASVSAAITPPAAIPLPPSTATSQPPSRKTSIIPVPTPPHQTLFTRSVARPLPTQMLHSLPPGFIPTHWKPHPQRAF